jgi:hypothetical protein
MSASFVGAAATGLAVLVFPAVALFAAGVLLAGAPHAAMKAAMMSVNVIRHVIIVLLEMANSKIQV